MWTPLFSFYRYRYNLIAVQLFLLWEVQAGIAFRCNERIKNRIKGGLLPIRISLLPNFLRKFAFILNKYNIIYQEQVTTCDSLALCIWTQFRKWPFTSHISTQSPFKFYRALCSLLQNDNSYTNLFQLTFNYDTNRLNNLSNYTVLT